MTFPWVRDRVAQGRLSLHGWYFDIGNGRLKYYNQVTGEYDVLVDRYAPPDMLTIEKADGEGPN